MDFSVHFVATLTLDIVGGVGLAHRVSGAQVQSSVIECDTFGDSI